MDESKPVVVGVDGSDQSIEALREGKIMADLMNAPLMAVAAWQWPAASGEIPELVGYDPEQEARQRLDGTLAEAFGDEPPASLQTVVQKGQPAQVLTELSKGARMLVVGSRGRGGFRGLLLGSVSSAVGAHAACPVLIMHGRTE
ncbi:universal stress protein [Micrococcus sp. TA1]|jgi:nucleotide-binding universal stress UspA family protein|uniref:universal stress protein n=1 Tax=Micrococcus sp. TA1 TaxID=681627 RepID=UPI00162018DC|nr:universal stress protein [Micrococcus sp. TA1]MBB5750287.1 nucleotide-binding universal stress UspA family protein [Micrococcus sp. TA1]